MTVASENILSKIIGSYGDSLFLTDANEPLSYSEFGSLVDQICKKLLLLDLPPKARIAVALPNSPAYLAIIVACFDLEFVTVLINPRLTEIEIRAQLELTGCTCVISSTLQFTSTLPCPQYLLSDLLVLSTTQINYSKPCWQEDAPACIFFTSGSHGKSKAVVHTIKSIFSAATASNRATGFTRGNEWLVALPFHHVAAFQIFIRAMISGAQIRILNDQKASTVIDSLEESAGSHISLVPTQLQEILEIKSKDFIEKNLSLILLGGAPSNRTLLDQLPRITTPILHCYGMTETCSHVTCVRPESYTVAQGNCGHPLADVTVEIRDENENPLPPETSGTVWINAAQIASGYIFENNQFEPIGDWFKTSDIGSLNMDGSLQIHGRNDNVFISGGENISIQEIEETLLLCPIVKECAVVVIPSERWGSRPLAFVVLREPAPSTQVSDYISTRLASFKKPDQIIVIDTIPRTAIGKINYTALKNWPLPA